MTPEPPTGLVRSKFERLRQLNKIICRRPCGLHLLSDQKEEAKNLQKRLLVDAILELAKIEPDKANKACTKV